MFKKILAVMMVFNILFLAVLYEPSQVQANVISKPMTITAKKVAKDVAKDTAVSMAEQIVSDFLVKELIDGIKTDDGYSAVCMDTKVDNMKDCAPEKRAQVKTDLSSSDKDNLANKVEDVLENKTKTSSGWSKFMDWFIPIFLVAGAVDFIYEAIKDGDIMAFFDDVAQDALIETGLIKPLLADYDLQEEILDFAKHVQTFEIKLDREDSFTMDYKMNVVLKPNTKITHSFVHNTSGQVKQVESTSGISAVLSISKREIKVGADYFGFVDIGNVQYIASTSVNTGKRSLELYRSSIPRGWDQTGQDIRPWIVGFAGAFMVSDPNEAINGFINAMNVNQSIKWQFHNLTTTKPTPPVVDTNYGTQTGIKGLETPEGTIPLRGMNTFNYTYGDTNVYPATDSPTGWKDKTTGEEITVIEDDVIVSEDVPPPPGEEETPPTDNKDEFPTCKREMKLPDFKPIGDSFTNAFPFSIPWDIKRFVDNALGGVGSERPSWDLPMFGEGIKIEIPEFFDGWMPFMRGLIIVTFDIGIIYLFYRFMKGGGE